MVPLLTDLDLSCNLIASWDAIVPLTTELPNLAYLNLSSNALRLPVQDGEATFQPFRNLHTLVLNRCGVTFQQVSHFLSPEDRRPHCFARNYDIIFIIIVIVIIVVTFYSPWGPHRP
jgi:hypothetical protein